jgi:FtsH-binding integral membrane protein
MEFLKTITGKVITGLVALGVIAAAISWWQMDPNTRQMLIGGTERIFAWLGVVLILPWATFFLIGRIAKLENNPAGGGLVAGYTIVEMLLLVRLFHWRFPNAAAWTFVVVGGLFAAAYNLFTCDFIAEKLE